MERRKFLQRILGASLAIPVIPLLIEKEVVAEPLPELPIIDDDPKDNIYWGYGEGLMKQMESRNITLYTNLHGMREFEKAILALSK